MTPAHEKYLIQLNTLYSAASFKDFENVLNTLNSVQTEEYLNEGYGPNILVGTILSQGCSTLESLRSVLLERCTLTEAKFSTIVMNHYTLFHLYKILDMVYADLDALLHPKGDLYDIIAPPFTEKQIYDIVDTLYDQTRHLSIVQSFLDAKIQQILGLYEGFPEDTTPLVDFLHKIKSNPSSAAQKNLPTSLPVLPRVTSLNYYIYKTQCISVAQIAANVLPLAKTKVDDVNATANNLIVLKEAPPWAISALRPWFHHLITKTFVELEKERVIMSAEEKKTGAHNVNNVRR